MKVTRFFFFIIAIFLVASCQKGNELVTDTALILAIKGSDLLI